MSELNWARHQGAVWAGYYASEFLTSDPEERAHAAEVARFTAALDDSLDAAWTEAEAALPDGWEHLAVRRERRPGGI